jgi:PGF-CTERM protein
MFISNILILNVPTVEADDQANNATGISDLETHSSWICSPDCGTEAVDEYDWYKTTIGPNDVGQLYVENTGEYSAVTILVELYEANMVMVDQFEVESENNDSYILSNNKSTSEQYFVSITTNDGWYDDGTNYSIFLTVQYDNNWSGATDIEVGSFLDEDVVCISDCPGDAVDPEDWYHFTTESGQSIGIVAEELTWFTYLDFELFTLDSGTLTSFEYEYHGGSAGGLQDYSVRAWFNTTEVMDVYVRVYTDQPDDVMYNLSVSSGTWVDVVEDDYHWVAFPELKIGDEVRVQAIRTDTPNDLDVLLYNNSEFENYRNEVVNNETTSPSELLAEEDCLVCSISFVLSSDKVGLMDAKPPQTHDVNQVISWSPTLVLVADYTDYLKNPPSNSKVDVASVFLSISVINSVQTPEYFEIHKFESSQWIVVDAGTTHDGQVDPPPEGWSSDSTSIDSEGSSTLYRLIVQDFEGGAIITNSTFEVINSRPESCLDIEGSLSGTITENIPIRLDASCSSDFDNDDLSYSWEIDGVMVTSSESFEMTFTEGTHTVELAVFDELGLVDNVQTTINVEKFPFDGYSDNMETNFSNQTHTSIKIENVLYENTSVAPQWLDFGIIGTQIGVGLNIESRITQVIEYDLSIVHSGGQTTVSRSTEMVSTETAMKVNLALFIVDIESGNETIYDLPMPMTEQVYDGQPWFPIGLFDRVYYWGDLAVVDTSGPTSEFVNNASFDIEIPALDLMEYIATMASNIPGSQIPLLALGIAVDYNLYLDINLEFEIINAGGISEIFMDGTTQQNIQSTGSSLVQSINQSVDYYSYSTLDSSIDIYGGIGMKLRIAQPGWLTTGLGFFYEDPMFLEGIWEYNITESEGPMATTNGMVSNLANTSVTFTLIEVIVENNTQDDSDADGVVDSSDACPGYDDTVDADTDGIPDGCDSLIDSDSDGVSDTNDVCLGHNDSIDIDQDGIADGCDSLIDSDADGVSDADDQCAGYNDLLDQDGDGIPDNCDQTPMSEDDQTNVADTNPVDDGETTGIPGFGLLLSITAALGAALIATRRE